MHVSFNPNSTYTNMEIQHVLTLIACTVPSLAINSSINGLVVGIESRVDRKQWQWTPVTQGG